ncbi:MAG: FUSC family protein [Mycobacteriaceae bacterium]|nr:FUSC family protein [Mycobacteriaceae bacterium]
MLAVAATYVVTMRQESWVVVGMITVLGSSALTTRTKTIQTIAGTAIGVMIGGAVVAIFGSQRGILVLLLLPLAVFGSVYLERVFSFVAGEAMITVTGLIFLDMAGSTEWWIGLLRIGNIALGAGIAILVSLLLWPRGATAAVFAAIHTALMTNLRYLHAAVLRVTRGDVDPREAGLDVLSREALLLAVLVDDAIRQYLSETGSSVDMRSPLIKAANRVTWVRVVADTITGIEQLARPETYPLVREVLLAHTRAISECLAGIGVGTSQPITGEFVRALRAEASDVDRAVEAALPLAAVAANLAELESISASTRAEPTLHAGTGPRSYRDGGLFYDRVR